ncbi:substrate-binding domain-containing protein [Planctomonas sp. JC2975]|uniref:LacI family DNA-binding transcriptional regulator n=1 Tax=Planctomonas sp. JC2975 TaxID=2729626 RepID=UPI001474A563|nr:substrate-binding domain-containing protein [Planctomonas sp. JC2975]NNC13849.1 substrate-binding domain-containing protein [Planctomonas sp. JC2975]
MTDGEPHHEARTGAEAAATASGDHVRRSGSGHQAHTMAELARLAGTTVPTVSKVLNGRSDVSVATRERVMRLVEETGYRRRHRSGSQRDRETGGLVDLVISKVSGSWANLVLNGAERAAASAGLDVVVTVARPEQDAGADWVARILARKSRGATVALLSPSRTQLQVLSAAGIPLVLLDPSADSASGVPSIGTTDWAGGYAAAAHLAALGHRRVGLIAGSGDYRYGRARVDGFRAGLEQAGIPLPEELIESADWRRESAAVAAARMLALRKRPTALFACSDEMALGTYQAARALGLGVPDDLSIVGFDDLPESAWVTPGLTTVRQPIEDMASAAMRMLLRLRAGAPAGSAREELATELVVRESTTTAR